jgi:hypothetical protein
MMVKQLNTSEFYADVVRLMIRGITAQKASGRPGSQIF